MKTSTLILVMVGAVGCGGGMGDDPMCAAVSAPRGGLVVRGERDTQAASGRVACEWGSTPETVLCRAERDGAVVRVTLEVRGPLVQGDTITAPRLAYASVSTTSTTVPFRAVPLPVAEWSLAVGETDQGRRVVRLSGASCVYGVAVVADSLELAVPLE